MSKELECLKQIEDVIETKIGLGVVNAYLIDIIKQALLKAQENEDWNTIIEEYDIKPHEVREAFIMYKMMSSAGYTVRHIEKAQEQEKFFDDRLSFKGGSLMCGFDYKGKDIVAMPLDEYDKFMRQEEVLQIIKEKCLDNTNLDIIPSFEEYDTYYFYLKKHCVSQDMPIVKEKKMLSEEEFYLLKKYFNGGKNENNS